MSQKVTPKQLQAAHLLAQGALSHSVAKQLGIRRETLSRWKQKPGFQREIEAVTSDLRHAAATRLRYLADRAVYTIDEAYFQDFMMSQRRIQTALRLFEVAAKYAELSQNASKPAAIASDRRDNHAS